MEQKEGLSFSSECLVRDNLRLVGYETAPIFDRAYANAVFRNAGLSEPYANPTSPPVHHPDQLVFRVTDPQEPFSGLTIAIGRLAVESYFVLPLSRRVELWRQRRRGDIDDSKVEESIKHGGDMGREYAVSDYKDALTVLGKPVPKYLQSVVEAQPQLP